MSKVTIIVGRNDDPHTLAVKKELENLGRRVLCFDTFRGDSIKINFSNKGSTICSFKNEELNQNEIKSIWYRQKPVIPLPWWSPLQNDAARFSQREWRTVLQTLQNFLPNTYWINSPEHQRRINYKPKQLELAAFVGFKFPETIITNDPIQVENFIKLYDKVIYKCFSGYIFSDQSGILTSLITLESLKGNTESISRTPGIYQEFIQKDYEARVTVVGNRCFVCHIRTPKTGLGAVDWRHSHFDDIFEKGEIPASVITCIQRFQNLSKLNYGAYDFIISPDGQWYFLECNPAGQFLWMENTIGYKISLAIAENLYSGNAKLSSLPYEAIVS